MFTKTLPESTLAVLCLLFSASMWGIIWYPLRLLDQAGMSGLWSSLVMYLAAGVLVLPVLFKQAAEILEHKKALFSLAIAAGVTNVAFVIALIEGEVMRVMLLFYLSPIWTVLLGRWWLGETLSARAVVYFSIAMLGSLIMLWNPEMARPWPRGQADWLALIAGIAFSINNVLARQLSAVPIKIKTTVVWWGVVLVSLLAILFQQPTTPEVAVTVWASAWALGWLGIVAMTVAVLYGVAKMPVYRSSVIMLFELLVAAIAAWLLTDEMMSRQEWLGGVLILIAAYGVATLNNKER